MATVTAVALETSAGALGRVAAGCMQGQKSFFEDTFSICQRHRICGVYDGHVGDEAAAFCAERLPLHVQASLASGFSEDSLLSAFENCEAEMREVISQRDAGSTATLAVVRDLPGDKLEILVANCGDCRALLVTQGTILATADHRPDAPEERSRIHAAGGTVSDDGRIDGKLACSRALGDFAYKQNVELTSGQQKVSSVPDLYRWQADVGDLLIIGCDGVWDTLSNAQVSDGLKDGDLGPSVQRLLELCITKEADDNLTLMAVRLGAAPEEPPRTSMHPGDFLKVKPRDAELLRHYEAFCLRFGFSIKKQLVPKSAPVVSIEPGAAIPGVRFGGLPLPSRIIATTSAAATLHAPMRIAARGPSSLYLASARRVLAEQGELEVVALGAAIANAGVLSANLLAAGFRIVSLETGQHLTAPRLRVIFSRLDA